MSKHVFAVRTLLKKEITERSASIAKEFDEFVEDGLEKLASIEAEIYRRIMAASTKIPDDALLLLEKTKGIIFLTDPITIDKDCPEDTNLSLVVNGYDYMYFQPNPKSPKKIEATLPWTKGTYRILFMAIPQKEGP